MGSDELRQAQDAFARHFVSRAEEAVRCLEEPDYKHAQTFLQRERDNCMEAIRVLFDSDKAMGLRLLVAMSEMMQEFGIPFEHMPSLVEWVERYHEACADMPPSPQRMQGSTPTILSKGSQGSGLYYGRITASREL